MKFKFYLRLCSHFLIATIFAFVLASLFHSQFVMAELTLVGVNISLNDRISMSIDDLLGLYRTYGVVIALSLLLAFGFTQLIMKRVNVSPSILYCLAGGIGVTTALFAMHPILGITLLAGARSTFGLICQSFAGAIGGWVFSYMRASAKD
jgi:hypothetical protein